jgi:nucleotide-binding universal stress UspA family protein
MRKGAAEATPCRPDRATGQVRAGRGDIERRCISAGVYPSQPPARRLADGGAANAAWHDATVTSDRAGAYEAAQAFSRARRKANLRSVLAAFGGDERKLLSYEDVRRRLHAVEASLPVLEDVPLDAIVGSVGRYNDFTREFLPRIDADKSRWVGVSVAMTGPKGTPPVELYRIGQAYFVRDGNHRVSVARQLGAPTIQAYVTPVRARVPLSADVDPSDLILLEEHSRFNESTGIDELRPDASLAVTVPGAFERLREHIDVHRYFMGLDEERDVPFEEAVAHWYDTVYQPVVASIRAGGVMRDFPGRTETDLYLWLSEHRGRLEQELGFTLPSETIAEALGAEGGERLGSERREGVLHEVRARKSEGSEGEVAIADDLLVAIPDAVHGIAALEQALLVARRERSRVYALHVVPDAAALESEEVAALRAAVAQAAAAAEIEVQFAVTVGDPVLALRERAAWVDVVVAPMVIPTADGSEWRLAPRYQGLLRRSPRPVLVSIGAPRPFARALVAYDGGSRADQALFVGAYLAAKWDTTLVVCTVAELQRNAAATLDAARRYLERFGVTADYVDRRGAVPDALVSVAEERDCDLVLMGSYRYSRWLESLLGGVLERTLVLAGRPVLVL